MQDSGTYTNGTSLPLAVAVGEEDTAGLPLRREHRAVSCGSGDVSFTGYRSPL